MSSLHRSARVHAHSDALSHLHTAMREGRCALAAAGIHHIGSILQQCGLTALDKCHWSAGVIQGSVVGGALSTTSAYCLMPACLLDGAWCLRAGAMSIELVRSLL